LQLKVFDPKPTKVKRSDSSTSNKTSSIELNALAVIIGQQANGRIPFLLNKQDIINIDLSFIL
jgi:hypothetical protein